MNKLQDRGPDFATLLTITFSPPGRRCSERCRGNPRRERERERERRRQARREWEREKGRETYPAPLLQVFGQAPLRIKEGEWNGQEDPGSPLLPPALDSTRNVFEINI